jgi:hypothetical protein
MSGSSVVRFPARHAACVWIVPEGAVWLVLARGHGWLHSSYSAALADARWLAGNLGFSIRKVSP